MAENAPPVRPRVLLVAGEVREAWAHALSEASFDVRTTGWLDAVTAARIDPPDVVVVSGDLPQNAPQLLANAFRGAGFEKSPVVVAVLEPEEIERALDQPLRADRYVPRPVAADALAREVADASRAGRTRWKPLPADVVALSFIAASLLILGARMLVNGFYGLSRGSTAPAALDRVVLLAWLAALAVGIGVALAFGTRPRTVGQWRRVLPGTGFLLWLSGQSLRGYWPAAEMALLSLGLLAWVAWALLVKPRSPAARGWLIALAALLLLLAAAPWVTFAWISIAN